LVVWKAESWKRKPAKKYSFGKGSSRENYEGKL
jgi:hypothetical protein